MKARGGRRETTAKVLKDRRSPRRRGRMGTSVQNAPTNDAYGVAAPCASSPNAGATSHAVSLPDASSPAAFVVPSAHATHACARTRSSTPQTTGSQSVSSFADASSPPAALTVPGGHGAHACETTRSFTPHSIASHAVAPFATRSPATFVVPGAHATHDAGISSPTRKFSSHAAHVVFGPGTRSPPALTLPWSHGAHAFETTFSSIAHAHVVSAPSAGSSPASFVAPGGHGTQIPSATRWSSAHSCADEPAPAPPGSCASARSGAAAARTTRRRRRGRRMRSTG